MSPTNTGPPLQPSFRNRILTAFHKSKVPNPSPPPSRWKALQPHNVALHLTQDPEPETNETHRKLPSEHLETWTARKPQETTTPNPRILSGPIPRRVTREPISASARQEINNFKLTMEHEFLTPIERQVLNLLRDTSPASFFRPILEPLRPVLLVKPADVGVLREVQELVRGLPEAEKHLLARDLHRFLVPGGLYVLKLLLFDNEGRIRITTHTRGTEVWEGGEAEGVGIGPLERPTSREIFGGSKGDSRFTFGRFESKK